MQHAPHVAEAWGATLSPALEAASAQRDSDRNAVRQRRPSTPPPARPGTQDGRHEYRADGGIDDPRVQRALPHAQIRLFVAATERVGGQNVTMVFDRAHEAVGASTPDRIIRERSGGREVDAYDNASMLSGEVSPTHTFTIDYPGRVPEARIGALVVAPEDDLLFVSVMHWLNYRGAIVAYSNASSASGNPAPTRFEAYERAVMGLGVFREY